MTREQFTAKFQALLDDSDFMGFFHKRAKDLLNSGAIDLEKYENDFRLPKIILSVVLKEASYQYEPLNHMDKKTARNLEHF
jgi:chlorite dismutase